MKLISRKEAKLQGLPHYFTGDHCILGLIAPRRTSDAHCTCSAHKDAHKGRSDAHYAGNKVKRGEQKRKYYRENREAVSKSGAEYYAANKEEIAARHKNWRVSNKGKVVEYAQKHRAAKLKAIPAWFSELDELAIEEAFDLARRREAETGIKWEVDHIIPLQGKNVCGLHVAGNIRVIPQSENRSKGNKFNAMENL